MERRRKTKLSPQSEDWNCVHCRRIFRMQKPGVGKAIKRIITRRLRYQDRRVDIADAIV